jgi:hypothetical protein
VPEALGDDTFPAGVAAGYPVGTGRRAECPNNRQPHAGSDAFEKFRRAIVSRKKNTISLIGEADETYLSADRFPGFGAKYRETYSMTKLWRITA